jgi:hypothetical protein
MNITLIIAQWPEHFKGSQYTLHFSPNATERQIVFALDELADPSACKYKILRKEDLEETFLDHDDRDAHSTLEGRLADIYEHSKAPEKSFA